MATDTNFELMEGVRHEIPPTSVTPAAAEATHTEIMDLRSIAASIVERGSWMQASNQTMVDAMHKAGVEVNSDGDVVRRRSGVICARLDSKPFAGTVELLPIVSHRTPRDPLTQGV